MTPLQELRKLDLSKTHIAAQDFGFLALDAMRHLTDLNLAETQLTDASAPQVVAPPEQRKQAYTTISPFISTSCMAKQLMTPATMLQDG